MNKTRRRGQKARARWRTSAMLANLKGLEFFQWALDAKPGPSDIIEVEEAKQVLHRAGIWV